MSPLSGVSRWLAGIEGFSVVIKATEKIMKMRRHLL